MAEDYYWDYYNATTGGQYLDSQERLVVREFLDSRTPRLCLDIACGSGRFSLPVMDRGIRIVAGDRDPVPLKKLHNKLFGLRNKETIMHILRIDAEYLPFREKTFDCILSLQTIGYIDAQRFFSECNRILQDEGWLLFNEANRHSYKAVIHRRDSKSTRFYRHSHSEICSMLIGSGFQIEKVTGMNWLPIKRDSNNRWVPFVSKIESGLKLSNYPSISPWVFYVAQKRGNSQTTPIMSRERDNQ